MFQANGISLKQLLVMSFLTFGIGCASQGSRTLDAPPFIVVAEDSDTYAEVESAAIAALAKHLAKNRFPKIRTLRSAYRPSSTSRESLGNIRVLDADEVKTAFPEAIISRILRYEMESGNSAGMKAGTHFFLSVLLKLSEGSVEQFFVNVVKTDRLEVTSVDQLISCPVPDSRDAD